MRSSVQFRLTLLGTFAGWFDQPDICLEKRGLVSSNPVFLLCPLGVMVATSVLGTDVDRRIRSSRIEGTMAL